MFASFYTSVIKRTRQITIYIYIIYSLYSLQPVSTPVRNGIHSLTPQIIKCTINQYYRLRPHFVKLFRRHCLVYVFTVFV